MRSRIVHDGTRHLEYEIRKIVDDANRLKALGAEMIWENIGDPIAMGEQVAPWIREVVLGLAGADQSWGYCPSRGVNDAREFLAAQASGIDAPRVGPDDILFVSGVADAVDKVYDLIRRDARILMPSPCYSTHYSNEVKRGDYDGLCFRLDPHNRWLPDLEEMRRIVRYNQQVIGIALINPDNPTGMVYPPEVLRGIVEIAREYGLFLILDHIYAKITFNGAAEPRLADFIGDVPALVLRGISKEYPWPGARCAWITMVNRRKDPEFELYCQALVKLKMMEVCSTTLPQMSIPRVMSDPRYAGHLAARAKKFETRANETYEAFQKLDCVSVSRTQGAFYFSAVFKDGVLNDRQSLPIANPRVREAVEAMVKGVPADKRLVYYLMGAAGVCVTPLCGFQSELNGFRITLLRDDDRLRQETLQLICDNVKKYIGG